MQEALQDAWFYTRDGAQIGPVTLAELRGKVEEGALNPRLDLVWTQGQADWKPAGEIEGLFAKRTLPPPTALAPPSDPYLAPKLESVEETMRRIDDWPGARRRSFLLATVVFPMVWQLAVPMSVVFLTQQLGPQIMAVVAAGVIFVPLLVMIYYGLARLVNLGMSRWWYLANFVPGFNLWLGYRCFACPAGYAYHKKLDGAGVFLAIVYWMLVALGVLLLVAMVTLFVGMWSNPELLAQLREALRKAVELSSKR
ncbi:MAG: GYF domain-containing protein [Verrucomicrobiota bacterium]